MKSKCCNAEIKIAHSDEGTNWNECEKCGSPCEVEEEIKPDGWCTYLNHKDEAGKLYIKIYDYKNEKIMNPQLPVCLITLQEKQQFEKLKNLKTQTYVWLGYWRDKFPPEAVSALQDILESSKIMEGK